MSYGVNKGRNVMHSKNKSLNKANQLFWGVRKIQLYQADLNGKRNVFVADTLVCVACDKSISEVIRN